MAKQTPMKKEQAQSTAQQLASIFKSCRNIMRKDKGLNGDLDRLPMLTWIMFLKFLDDMESIRAEEAKLAGKRFRPAVEPPYRWRDWAANPQGITGPELIAFINQDEAVRPDGKRGDGLFAHLRSLRSANGDRRDVIAKVFQGTVNRMTKGYLLRDVVNKVNGIHFNSSDEIHSLGLLYESMLRETRDAAGDSGEFYTPRPVVKFIVSVIDPELGETVLDPAAGTGGFLVESFKHLQTQCRTAGDFAKLQNETLFGIEPKSLPYLLCEMNLLLNGLEYPQVDSGNALGHALREIGDKDRVDIIVTNPPFGGEEERGVLSNFPEDKQTSETALLFLQLIMRKLRRPTGGARPGRCGMVVPESVMSDAGIAQRIRAELIGKFNLHTIVRLPKGVFEPYSDIQTNLLFFDTAAPTSGIWFYQHEVPRERQQMRNPCYTQTLPLQYEELVPVATWWKKKTNLPNAWYVPLEEIEKQGFNLDFRNPNGQSRSGNNLVMVGTQLQETMRTGQLSVGELLERIEDLKTRTITLEQMKLSRFLRKARNEASIVPDQEYDQVTVKLYGKGVVRRQRLRGDQIKTRPQFLAKNGQLIMSRIDARSGAFGIVPPELDRAVVTNDFPLFEIDSSLVLPEFLTLLLRSSVFLEACRRSSRGTTNRKRLRENLFLDEILPIPERRIQEIAVSIAEAANNCEKSVGSAFVLADGLAGRIADFLEA